MSKFLVIIDMQTEFIKQCDAENIVSYTVEKIKLRKEEGYVVICTYDRSGGDIIRDVAEICQGDKIYKKHTYGCAELIEDLKKQKPDLVEFVGLCTDVCVITNVLATMTFLPFATLVVDSKCCASADDGHRSALKVLKSCNVKVI